MDLVTGAEVSIARVVAVPRERMWELITAVGRIGEWSPETVRIDGPAALVPGARFVGHNRYPDGFVSTVTCEITVVERPATFAYAALDDDGLAASLWRYELTDGEQPGTTLLHQTFRHGPGNTGMRVGAEADERALDRRLTGLCGNMLATIAAMTAMG
ncbi:SRPBCC family protein [Actinoplanes oblitus]|uniref:SRPBCC family protein n=1 Tax=Actinoplanes oblitus TaxID=3040509 RepID=A0ABY8W5W2_9ACTN|nr:SRPBCC family protein [Actinoplanes oblitus]WIM93219.1 SRPBCC family protein [Actinoplanes oblitus]